MEPENCAIGRRSAGWALVGPWRGLAQTLAWGWAITSCCLVGCGAGSQAQKSPREPSSYAELPGLDAAPHVQLQQELALLRQVGMTPTQLAPQAPGVSIQRASRPAAASPPAPTPIAAVQQVYPPLTRSMIAKQSGDLLPQPPLALGPGELERARELLMRYAQARARFPAALPQPGQPLGWKLTDGMLANLDFVDSYRAGARLELLAGLVALSAGRLEEAAESVRVVLHVAGVLSPQRHLTLRLTAAQIRYEGLLLLDRLAAHPAATPEMLAWLLTLVDEQLAAWPNDAEAWAGERAIALHAYELVRDGLYLSLLTPEELAELEERGVAKTTARAVVQQVDQDEQAYLDLLRRMLAACQSPYYARLPFLTQARAELRRRETQGQPALLAQQLLLPDFETAHRRQAEDLLHTLARQQLLRAALGQAPQAGLVNPLTGQPFALVRTAREVTLSWGAGEDAGSLSLPVRTASQPIPTRGAASEGLLRSFR